MQPVQLQSRTLASALYLPRRRQLELEFHSGKRYLYFQVPLQCYRELLRADSKGAYFNRHIRNCFPFQHLSHASAPLVLVSAKTK
jgi:hypothetical protein